MSDPLPPLDPRRRKLSGKQLILGLALTAALMFGFLQLKDIVFPDKVQAAGVGDCLTASSDASGNNASAKVVDCDSAEAAFVVAGRVDGVSDSVMDGKSTECEKFFTPGEQFSVYGRKSDSGSFLLCLRPKKPVVA